MKTKIHNRSIIFAAVGLRLTCGAILLSWFWPEQTSTDNFPGVFQPWADFYSFQLHSNLTTHFFFEQQVPMISQPFLGLSFWSLRLLCPRLGLATTCWTCYHWFLSPKKQPTFGDATAAWFPREMRSEERAQKFPTDDVLLSWAGQCFWLVENLLQPIKKGHYPDLDSNVSYGFCPPSSDVILRENRRCNREMPAVFSSLICFLSLLCLY